MEVFFHKDFKALLAHKNFRQYVYSLPQYKQAGQKFNEDVVKELTLKVDSMLKNPSKGPKWTGPFFGRKKPRVKTRKNRKEKSRQPKPAKAFPNLTITSSNKSGHSLCWALIPHSYDS